LVGASSIERLVVLSLFSTEVGEFFVLADDSCRVGLDGLINVEEFEEDAAQDEFVLEVNQISC